MCINKYGQSADAKYVIWNSADIYNNIYMKKKELEIKQEKLEVNHVWCVSINIKYGESSAAKYVILKFSWRKNKLYPFNVYNYIKHLRSLYKS